MAPSRASSTRTQGRPSSPPASSSRPSSTSTSSPTFTPSTGPPRSSPPSPSPPPSPTLQHATLPVPAIGQPSERATDPPTSPDISLPADSNGRDAGNPNPAGHPALPSCSSRRRLPWCRRRHAAFPGNAGPVFRMVPKTRHRPQPLPWVHKKPLRYTEIYHRLLGIRQRRAIRKQSKDPRYEERRRRALKEAQEKAQRRWLKLVTLARQWQQRQQWWQRYGPGDPPLLGGGGNHPPGAVCLLPNDPRMRSLDMLASAHRYRAVPMVPMPSRTKRCQTDLFDRVPLTAHTFQHLCETLRCIQAARAGPGLPLDFRCSNPDDGRLSALVVPTFGPFVSPQLASSLPWLWGRSAVAAAAAAAGSGDSVYRKHPLALATELFVSAPVRRLHGRAHLRWNLALGFPLPVAGSRHDLKDVQVEIQYKRVSGADLPLALDCGVDSAVFSVLDCRLPDRPGAQCHNADAPGHLCHLMAPYGPDAHTEATAARAARREQSWLYLVRLVGYRPGVRIRRRLSATETARDTPYTLMALGGWVAPPLAERIARADAFDREAARHPLDRKGKRISFEYAYQTGRIRQAPCPPNVAALVADALARAAARAPAWAVPARRTSDIDDFRPPVRCRGVDPELWREVAEPTEEDVLWLAWRLLTGPPYRGFRAGAGCGIDRASPANQRCLAAAWAPHNPFASPSLAARMHSAALLQAAREQWPERGG